jgi:hypothetical protein
MSRRISENRNAFLRIIWYAVLAAVVLLIFSPSTSPLYQNGAGSDSAIFQIVGRGWANGVLPYKELFDHKGPIIFFINALGYAICGNRYGILPIQIVVLCATFLEMDKLFRENEIKNPVAAVLFILPFFLVDYVMTYKSYLMDGNRIEEYCLPFLMYFFACVFRWLKKEELQQGDGRIPFRQTFLFGVGFGVCAFTRLTNGVGMAAAIMVIAVYEIKKKRLSALLGQAVSFLFGLIIVTVPFIVYFWRNNSLSEMWFATFTYNFSYAENGDVLKYIVGENATRSAIFVAILCWTPTFILYLFAIRCVKTGRRLSGILYGVTAVVSGLLFFHSRLYSFYYIISIPYIVLWVAGYKCIPVSRKASGTRLKKNCIRILFVCSVSCALYAPLYTERTPRLLLMIFRNRYCQSWKIIKTT